MCSYFFNFRIINAIFRPPKKLDLEQWPRPLFEVLGYIVKPTMVPQNLFVTERQNKSTVKGARRFQSTYRYLTHVKKSAMNWKFL